MSGCERRLQIRAGRESTRRGRVNPRGLMPGPLSGFKPAGYNQPLTSATGQGDLRCPQRRMPELSSIGRRLARRVVQDRVSGVSGTGLPIVSATSGLSTRKDRPGTVGRALGNATRRAGRSLGRIPGDLGGRNAARLYVGGLGRRPVWSVLDPARSQASRRAPTSETRRTIR
jgi:hypothetical protein